MAHLDRKPDALQGWLTRLLDARERVLEEMIMRRREIVDAGPRGAEAEGDQADLAQARERQTVSNGLVERCRVELAEIRAARERISAGTYGLCAECGEPIGAGRLRAQPTALRCIDCQSRHEQSVPAAAR